MRIVRTMVDENRNGPLCPWKILAIERSSKARRDYKTRLTESCVKNLGEATSPALADPFDGIIDDLSLIHI